MIDYFSLALGHGLLAIALFRLVMRDNLDVDPELQKLKEEAEAAREAASAAGRNAKRRTHEGREPALKQRSGSADKDALKQRSGSAE